MSTFHKEYFLDLYAPNQDRLGEFAAEAEESLEKPEAAGNRSAGALRGLPCPVFCEVSHRFAFLHISNTLFHSLLMTIVD